jgi:phosphatidate cytidylyltransferase
MKRVLTASVLLPILLFAVWSSVPYYFIALVGVAVMLGLREFYIIAEKLGCRCHTWLGYGAALAVLFGFYQQDERVILAALLLLQAVMFARWLFREKSFEALLVSTSATLAGVVYVAVFLGHFILLRMTAGHDLAARLITFCLFLIFASDTGAYYTGRLIGRHKLAPHVSPGKTIEGSVGGLLSALAVAVLCKYWFFPAIPLADALVLAVVINIVGAIGDLCESMLKRGANVKDAASFLPGHGGMLDRLDSILFNAPVIYSYYRFFYHG